MLTLPIYYEQTFKTKPPKTLMVGLNWYRNCSPFLSNKVKAHYHELVHNQSCNLPKLKTFTIHYSLFYKNPACDGGNIIALIEKFLLDGLASSGVISNDNVLNHLGSTWTVTACDKLDPRVEITISEV